ncbi:MAG: hypothetical protein EOP20_13200 [Hyphomicrobiales bacterium]|nr:MAG: hypothetical protein EOP20_13200 [Hyphomicrobiales bacterium]
MSLYFFLRPVLGGALLLFAGGSATAQRPETVTALRSVERGQWQLKDATGRIRKLCLTRADVLLQIEHGAAKCDHHVVENTARVATIRYNCPGRGNGRTTINVESGKLFSLDTQGVADGSPFSEQYEGRLLGAC